MAKPHCVPRLATFLAVALFLLNFAPTAFTRTLLVDPADPGEGIHTSNELPGVQRAKQESDLEGIFRDGLNLDFIPWQKRAPLTITALEDAIGRIARGETNMDPTHMALVIVKDTHVYYTWLSGQGPPNGFFYRWPCLFTTLILMEKTPIPNTIFLYNPMDYAMCRPGNCSMPIFSHYKLWSSSPDGVRDDDILIPQVNHVHETVVYYDWSKKAEKVLFRGSGQCTGVQGVCARLDAWRLSQKHPEVLDIGFISTKITQLPDNHISPVKVLMDLTPDQLVQRVPLEHHAKWKYLASMDGYTGTVRLWKILSMNSVVLKEKSPWVDSHMRSLVPGVHYVEFHDNQGDITSLLDAVEKLKANDEWAKNISRTGQEFTYRYRSRWSQGLHLRRAIVLYNELFGGELEKYVAGLATTVGEPRVNDVRDAILARAASRMPAGGAAAAGGSVLAGQPEPGGAD